MPVLNKSTGNDTIMDGRNFNNTKNGHTSPHERRSIDTTDNAPTGNYFLSSKYSTEIAHETKSFIQQRVERLYGPGALAQGFYSPRKTKTLEKTNNCITQYSYSSFQKDINNSKQVNNVTKIEHFENIENGEDLPVLRHLRPEFRAQLPIISPKRSQGKFINSSSVLVNGTNNQHLNGNNEESVTQGQIDEVNSAQENGFNSEKSDDNVNMSEAIKSVVEMKISYDCELEKDTRSDASPKKIVEGDTKLIEIIESTQKDGNYFLQLLKTEQDRLLNLASEAEREIDLLSTSNVPEEILGYLRCAAGKARLLVSQKMKQFEGLCKNNLYQLPGEKFPTTNEDLQGFWDMVKLQIDHVDSLFDEINLLRSNNWKKPLHDAPNPPSGSKLVKRPLNTKSGINSSVRVKSATTNGTTSKKSATSALSTQKREAQRKQLLELKRRNKMAISSDQQQTNSNSVEIFVNENYS